MTPCSVITASVPLLEPPGWAVAERELFDLLDHAWRRFARDFTGPDGRLSYRHTLTSRDGVDDFYETFFNWPQLYLLGGADDLLAEAERHWEGVTAQLTELGMLSGRVRARLRLVPPGREPAAALLPVHGRPGPVDGAGGAVRRAVRRPRPRQLRPRAPHHPPPAQRLRPRPRRPVRRAALPVARPEEAERTASRSTGCCPAGAPVPERDQDPRLTAEMTARMGVGDTAVNLAAAGLVLNAWILTGDAALPGLDRAVRRRVAGARRGQRRHHARTTSARTAWSAACSTAAGTAGTTAGPGRTAGTASAHAATVAALAARHRHRRRRLPGPGAPGPGHDHRPRQGHGLRRVRLLHPVQVGPAAGRRR